MKAKSWRYSRSSSSVPAKVLLAVWNLAAISFFKFAISCFSKEKTSR